VNLGPAIAIYDELIGRIDETIRKQSAVAGVGTYDRPVVGPGGVKRNTFDGGGDGSFGGMTPGFGGSGGGGNVYVTINVAPGANPSEIGRQFVDYIAAYERTNGKGWRAA
jgi:hypothetical protein